MTTVQVSARVREDIPPRLDAIAEGLAERLPGSTIQRSDALRAVIEKGVEVMERELGLSLAQKRKRSESLSVSRTTLPDPVDSLPMHRAWFYVLSQSAGP